MNQIQHVRDKKIKTLAERLMNLVKRLTVHLEYHTNDIILRKTIKEGLEEQDEQAGVPQQNTTLLTRNEVRERMKILIIPVSCLVLLSAIGGASVPAFAHTEKYNIGYSQGQTKATADYYVNDNGHNDYNPRCPTYDVWTEANGSHSSNFCAGFIDGYNAQWTALAPEVMQKIKQQNSQDSTGNIKGSNNLVTVNQQINNNVGGQNGYGSGSTGHSILPRCFILCSDIQVH